jgi:hypothetical protein
MGKYEPLTHYLENQAEETWDASFSDVERVLGFALPRSACEYAAWWANQEPGHSQTAAGGLALACREPRYSGPTPNCGTRRTGFLESKIAMH